jgi:hypothetical protein
MPFERAYSKPAALSAIHPARRAARKPPSDWFIGLILAFGCLVSGARGQEPPPNLPRRIAHQESETQAAREEYNYRQTVAFAELDGHGATAGEYREERDVILSPQHERTEKMIGKPLLTLKRLKLTDEDFADMRGIQPFVMTEDQLWNYETKFRGDEKIDGVDCWVLQVRPRQILQGQRLFDGLLWADKRDYSIVRLEGQAVPQMLSTKSENLFPRFTTIREVVDGQHRFPVYTYADDTLPFSSGLQRVRMTIRYTQYKRFGADSVIKFDKAN